ncbi:MAG: heme biosynthesis protein HemY [Legionellales bacterium]|nr:heme biosynthesis protein HemY [Legionellales bacterium]
MKKYLFYLMIFILALIAGVLMAKDPGYALFAYSHWTVQMPLWVAGILFILSFLIIYNLLLLIRGTSALAKRFSVWRRQYKQQQSHRTTKRGLLELAEGKWANAEHLLMKSIDQNSAPLINYLASARAAQEQGAYDRRDEYLKKAHESTPGSEVAVGLTQAQLQLSHKQLEHSLATLRHLQHLEPKHVFVLKMLKNLYCELKDWQALRELLPELKKRKAIKPEKYQVLETQVYRHLIEQAQQQLNLEALNQLWQEMPKYLRKSRDVVLPYVDALHQLSQDELAENLLFDVIRQDWDNSYVTRYGLLKTSYPEKQLERAEVWLKQYGSSPALYLCLGRLCLRNQLWGKARAYLQQCLDLEENADACAELAKLLEYLGEKEEALIFYRRGLMQLVEKTEILSL